MSNYDIKADDIVRCKDYELNPFNTKDHLCAATCPLFIKDDKECYCIRYRIPDDNWFCANGGYLNNIGTTADIVRCKDCINNPYYAKGFNKRACPHDESFYKSVGYKTPKKPYGEWFCANGERGEILK